MREIQHAEVTVRVAKSFDADFTDDDRMNAIADLVNRALNDGKHFEGRGVIETELTLTETPDEAGERRMAEAEAREEARLERLADQHFERRGFRGDY